MKSLVSVVIAALLIGLPSLKAIGVARVSPGYAIAAYFSNPAFEFLDVIQWETLVPEEYTARRVNEFIVWVAWAKELRYYRIVERKPRTSDGVLTPAFFSVEQEYSIDIDERSMRWLSKFLFAFVQTEVSNADLVDRIDAITISTSSKAGIVFRPSEIPGLAKSFERLRIALKEEKDSDYIKTLINDLWPELR
jgi:hypothetical protein